MEMSMIKFTFFKILAAKEPIFLFYAFVKDLRMVYKFTTYSFFFFLFILIGCDIFPFFLRGMI